MDVRWLLAVVILLVNDHWAKGRWPGLVTGKVSDFAGLLAASGAAAMLLVHVGSTPRTARLVAVAATGGVFTAVKLSQPVSDAVFERTGLGHVIADRTDLVALAVLPLAWRVLAPARLRDVARPEGTADRGRILRQRLALAFACVVCLATSERQELLAGTVGVAIVPAHDGRPAAIVAATDAGGFVSVDDGRSWTATGETDYPVLAKLATERFYGVNLPGRTVLTTLPPPGTSDPATPSPRRACFETNRCVKVTDTDIADESGVLWSVDGDARARVVGNLDAVRYGGRPLPGLGQPVSGVTTAGERVLVPYTPDRLVVGSDTHHWRVSKIGDARPFAVGDAGSARVQLLTVFVAGLALITFVFLSAPGAGRHPWRHALYVTLLGAIGVFTYGTQLLAGLDSGAGLLVFVVFAGPVVLALAGTWRAGAALLTACAAALLAPVPYLLWVGGSIKPQFVAALLAYGTLAAGAAVAYRVRHRTMPGSPRGPSVPDGAVASTRAEGLLDEPATPAPTADTQPGS